jgi:hypothetical protein
LDSGELDEAHEVDKQLVISCCGTPELLELIEKALDEIALFIEINVIRTLDFAVAFGRDDDFAFACGNLFMQVIGIVAFVGDGGCGGKSVDEFVCMISCSCPGPPISRIGLPKASPSLAT